jgi:hypothetical protein
MLAHRQLLEAAIAAGDAVHAALYAGELNSLSIESSMQFKWGSHAQAWENSRAGSRKGGEAHANSPKIKDKQRQFFEDYDDKIIRGWDPRIARQRAAGKAGYSDDHARRLLNRR